MLPLNQQERVCVRCLPLERHCALFHHHLGCAHAVLKHLTACSMPTQLTLKGSAHARGWALEADSLLADVADLEGCCCPGSWHWAESVSVACKHQLGSLAGAACPAAASADRAEFVAHSCLPPECQSLCLPFCLPLGTTPGPSTSSSSRRHSARQLTTLALFTLVTLPTPLQLDRA